MPTINGQNFAGPYELAITYTCESHQHVQRLNCDVQGTVNIGDLPATITLETRDSTGINLQTAVDNWIVLLKPLFSNQSTFDRFDFYSVTTQSSDRAWITGGVISENGTFNADPTLAQQTTYTFRSSRGGRMRISLMETVKGTTLQFTREQLGTPDHNFIDFLISADSWVLARDNGYPLVSLKISDTQNESLYRRRYRNN